MSCALNVGSGAAPDSIATCDRCAGGVRLEAAALAAGAHLAVRVDRDVADLAGQRSGPPERHAMRHDHPGDAGADHDDEAVRHATRTAQQALGQPGGPHVVLEHDRHAEISR